MMDDIGLGRALASVLYLFILFITITGAGLLIFLKKKKFAFWWVSVMANVFAFLHFLGDSSTVGWIIRVFSIIAWPIINIAWLLDLVRGVRRGKGKKK
jgi:hypothetical protein